MKLQQSQLPAASELSRRSCGNLTNHSGGGWDPGS